MDVTFSNVLEGTRQYFMGVPKQAQTETSGQTMWPSTAVPTEEGAPAKSGAPAPTSRPPSAAAAPPTTPGAIVAVATVPPPRPPSEPLEPEPHIIHKATVMREAAEKRREQPETEDDEEHNGTLSPPSHIIRKPTPHTMPSPAPAPAAPCPSPARPPSELPLSQQSSLETQQEPSIRLVQTPTLRPPDHYNQGRLDPYTASRPPEPYPSYHYDANLHGGNSRSSHRQPLASPQPSVPPRHSPLTYLRMTGSMPQQTPSARLRDLPTHSPPAQRHVITLPQPLPPHNDRVPPIHHPQMIQPSQRNIDSQPPHGYPSQHISQNQQRRDSLPFGRPMLNNDRYVPEPPRKHDPQHTYPGYRPRTESHYQPKYTTLEPMSHNMTKSQGRAPMPSQHNQQDAMYISAAPHSDYLNRTVDIRNSYPYMTNSTTQSGLRYIPNAQANGAHTTVTPRTAPRQVVQPSSKPRLEYPTSSNVQTPSRTATKPLPTNQQQSRMTVSVSTLVDQMNQIKQQKRESPLDLSVKTVKNSADSSTTQEDVIDSISQENKPLPLEQRPLSNNRHIHHTLANSHKVEFTPDFSTYGSRDRNTSLVYPSAPQQAPLPTRHNGAYDVLRSPAESFTAESRYTLYSDRNKQKISVGKSEYFPNHKIDLTESVVEKRYPDKRIYDDRNFIIERRKRQRGPIVSNIPEKIYRTETWASARHIDHITKSAREQRELMKQPVFSYASHQRNESYQNEQKNLIHQNMYRDHRHHHHQPNNYNYAYPNEQLPRESSSSYHPHYPEKSLSNSSRPVIQTLPNLRDAQIHHSVDSRNGIPIDKSVKSLLRSSLESKQTSYSEPVRPTKQIPDLIVIDDGDDAVIEIIDENETEVDTRNVVKSVTNQANPVFSHQIQMPKAVDSISEYPKFDSADQNKSPENDVASRIRTKAELKVMPPSQDNTIKPKNRQDLPLENVKLLPKSQKQHIFNQIREDFRLESVIKSEKVSENIICEVKSEPMNIDEIEKDATISLKTENNNLENLELNRTDMSTDVEDLDFANALESFVEQLKIGFHKKKARRKHIDTSEQESDAKVEKSQKNNQIETESIPIQTALDTMALATVKQEPIDEAENNLGNATTSITIPDIIVKNEPEETFEEVKNEKEEIGVNDYKFHKNKTPGNVTPQLENMKSSSELTKKSLKNEVKEADAKRTVTKEELESTDDDEPLIKSKILKEKEKSERLKHQLLRDLSEKSAIVKLECCDTDMNKNVRKSIDLVSKDKEDKQNKQKTRQTSRSKGKSLSIENKNEKQKVDSSSDSDEDNFSVASRLRLRKNTKNDENKSIKSRKSPAKSPTKKSETCATSTSSILARKPGFGDGSDFHPGWEEELYRYKRSLRMPTRLIAIPRGRSGGPFVKGSSTLFTRGSTSLPDLDPTPLSPAPSSAPSAATDDLFARRPDKLTIDSDLDSNSSCSVPIKLNYDSEASTSTVFSSSNVKKKGSSIVDVLIQKCGRKEDSKRKSKEKDKDDQTPKITPKTSNAVKHLTSPSLANFKDGKKGNLSNKKEKLMEEIYNLGAFRKETVTAYRKAYLNKTGSLINATETFRPVSSKSKRRTESRILKQPASIKEVFGDERPASAPPTSCIEDNIIETQRQLIDIKKEPEVKAKLKPKKNIKGKLQRRSSSIKDGLRSTKSLKRNDANGRLMRLKNRNNLMKSLASKRTKDLHGNKHKKEKTVPEETDTTKEIKEEIPGPPGGITKRRLKRLFVRRKFSSGFDYIRKKKKIVRREETNNIKVRRPAVKPSPESVHDIHKEIKTWFINKSIGETHLHRAARLGYMDCVAYCLEKLESDPSARDNAGFTPLHVAAARGHVKIARLLLQYGADVSAAAQGGIRPLHEACENCHVEVIRLLLSYGADPLLGTYADQTPEELAEGPSALLLRLHIADVQGHSVEPWRFPPPNEIIDSDESGCFPLSSPPPASPLPTIDSALEFHCSEAPLPPFYSLRAVPGQPADGLWCLLQDINNLLQIKSKESLLKQIHCGSGSPKELVQEIRTQEFLERAQCHQLMCAGEKVNVRASKVALVRVTDKLRQLLKMETVLVS